VYQSLDESSEGDCRAEHHSTNQRTHWSAEAEAHCHAELEVSHAKGFHKCLSLREWGDDEPEWRGRNAADCGVKERVEDVSFEIELSN
jgi:hypothetical protein